MNKDLTQQEKLERLNNIIEQVIILEETTHANQDNVLLSEALANLENHRINTFGHQIDWNTAKILE